MRVESLHYDEFLIRLEGQRKGPKFCNSPFFEPSSTTCILVPNSEFPLRRFENHETTGGGGLIDLVGRWMLRLASSRILNCTIRTASSY